MKKTQQHKSDDIDEMMFPAEMSPLVKNENFIWVDDIDERQLLNFYKEFSRLEENPTIQVIPIVVSSNGGEVTALLAMRDLIKSSSKQVCTIVLGKAQSAGACLAAAGTRGLRFASKDSIIMIHEVSGGMSGKLSEAAESVEVMKALNKKMMSNLAADCGIPLEQIEKRMASNKNVDWTLTSGQAKKLGLIDRIEIPRVIFEPPASHIVIQPSIVSQMSKRKRR